MQNRFGHAEFLPGIQLWALDQNHLLNYLAERRESNQSTFIVTLNPLMVMDREKNTQFLDALDAADIIVADGQGIRWGFQRIHGKTIPLLPGVELAEQIISLAADKGWSVGLLGGKPGIWEKARDNLGEKYPGLKVEFGHHGYFKQYEEPVVVEQISVSGVKVLVAGMGFPKQELFLNKHRDVFMGTILIGVGGSLDVYSGTVKRAPGIFQKLKTEWLWRMIREPKRFSQFFVLVSYVFMILKHHKSLLK